MSRARPIAQLGDPTNPFVAGDYRLSGTLSWQLTKRDALSYDHNGTASDETAGRVTDLQGESLYPGSSRDQSDALELHHVLGPQFGLYAGTYYRRRVCCPSNGDTVGNENGVLNGLLHEYHLEVDYISPQLGPGKIQIGAGVRGVLAPHHVSEPDPTYINGPGGAKIGQQFTDASRTQPGAFGKLFLRVPVPPKTKVSLFGTFQFGGGDWEQYAPIQYLYDIFDYGFDRQLGKNASLRAYIDQLTQTNQGYPFVPPRYSPREAGGRAARHRRPQPASPQAAPRPRRSPQAESHQPNRRPERLGSGIRVIVRARTRACPNRRRRTPLAPAGASRSKTVSSPILLRWSAIAPLTSSRASSRVLPTTPTPGMSGG